MPAASSRKAPSDGSTDRHFPSKQKYMEWKTSEDGILKK